MSILIIYELAGIMMGLGGVWQVVRHHADERMRHAVALEKNTEATDRLTDTVTHLADVVTHQDKRIDKLEWRVFGL